MYINLTSIKYILMGTLLLSYYNHHKISYYVTTSLKSLHLINFHMSSLFPSLTSPFIFSPLFTLTCILLYALYSCSSFYMLIEWSLFLLVSRKAFWSLFWTTRRNYFRLITKIFLDNREPVLGDKEMGGVWGIWQFPIRKNCWSMFLNLFDFGLWA